MPLGFAPNCWNVLPSTFVCSHETSDQVPTSCSFSDCCWPTAGSECKESANAALVHAPTPRRFIPRSSPGQRQALATRHRLTTCEPVESGTLPSDSHQARRESPGMSLQGQTEMTTQSR